MIVYRIPPEARQEMSLFSVMGQDLPEGRIDSELFLEPGPVFLLPPEATIVSSRICSGSLRQRLSQTKDTYGVNLWFLIEPMCHLFPLPCPDYSGKPVSEKESLEIRKKHTVYDSPDFLCQYCVMQDCDTVSVHLFDTPQTAEQKIRLAESIGIDNIIYIM